MIELSVLGSAALRADDGHELHAVVSQPGQLALLAYLAIARPRGLHRRDTLVALFWPDVSQEQARNALRQATHRLRRAVGAHVVVGRGAEDLGIDRMACSCDAVCFEERIAAGDRVGGLELYRGELLRGFFVPAAPGFEDWLEAERRRLRELATSAAWMVADDTLRRGDAAEAARRARWAAAQDADDEAALRRLVALLVRLGDHAGAMRAYESFAERLAREYDVEPSTDTRALVAGLPRAGTRARAATDWPERSLATSEPAVATPIAASHPSAPTLPDEARQPAAPRASRRGRRPALLAIAAGAAVVAGVVAASWGAAAFFGRPAAREAVAVFPFSVRGASSLAYLREGMVDLLSAKLEGVPGFRSIDPHLVLAGHPVATAPDEAARAAARLGAGSYVLGDVTGVGDRVQLSATMYATRGASPIASTSVEGDAVRLPELVDALAGRLLAGRVQGRDPTLTELAAATTRSLPALVAFLTGERALRAGRDEEARAAFLDAVRIDSTFALADARLASTYGWSLSSGPMDPVAHLARAERHADRLTPLARGLLEGYDAYYRVEPARAEGVFRELTAAYPDRVEAWYMLGEVLAHRAPLAGRSPFVARDAFARVLALEPDDAHALVHLARIAAAQGDQATVASLVGRFEALHVDADRALEMRALRAFALHDSAAVRALAPALRSADAIELNSVIYAATMYAPDREGAAMTRDALDARRGEAMTNPLPLALIPATSFVRGRIVHGERSPALLLAQEPDWPTELRALLVGVADLPVPHEALSALRDTIGAWRPHPSDSAGFFAHHAREQPTVRSYLLALLSLRLGDTASTIAALGDLDARAALSASSVARPLSSLVRAEIAARAGHAAEALAQLDRARDGTANLVPLHVAFFAAHERWLRAQILASSGRTEDAIDLYQSLGEGVDAVFLAPSYPLVARLLARAGRHDEARWYYDRFADLWRDCDPELRPLVQQARDERAHL